ncbi:type III polyketide synthase [Streptomyces parvulus]|uniref:type III polyketide synthase n=1 Tax=Streptomyces TaxID=1883 RepID=UPI001E355CE3|nr:MULTISPECIES: type III polyketide synthase [Streptomyces]MCC9158599.1 type III polyketide synthase [Streptomyces parvulus]MCE7691143.1 type III polyketide synthase [Streptomyces parvulus]WML84305.1 type III polyketide synthase [Streptomyces sp. VNUA74]
MAAYLCPPAVIHGEHAVKTSQIVEEVRERHPHAAWAPRIDSIAASTGIESRGWMLPLETAVAPGASGALAATGAGPARAALARDGFTERDVDRVIAALDAVPAPQTVQERTAPAWEAVQAYGERAARGALQIAGLDVSDVDCLITSNSTTPALPGLDVALANRLPLRSDAMLLPASQWACVAGTRSLALAADLVAADPDRVVLVVISEALSTTYQPADDTLESLIVRLLFADTAVAAVVTGRPRPQSVLRLDASWNHTLPDTQDLHRLETRADGTHFVMDRRGPRAVQNTVTAMWEWLDERYRDDPHSWHPDVLLAHPGGTRVLEYMEQTMPEEWPSGLLDHSRDSYTSGNRGGAAVFDILRRAHDAGQAPGSRAVLYAAAPGLTATALEGQWL